MKIRNLLKVIIIAYILAIPVVVQADESGRAKLWFDIPGASYIGERDNPWLSESWLIKNPSFTLNVKNMLDSKAIYDAHLVLAIPHDAISGSWSVQIGSTVFDYADFSHAGEDHPYLSRHGIFGGSDGAKWAEFTIGDIEALQTIPLSFATAGSNQGFLFHIDAYGSSKSDRQDGRYFAPYSHDANLAPEPISAALFLLGGGAMAVRQYRKRKTKV